MGDTFPAYCHDCGKPYPWTDAISAKEKGQVAAGVPKDRQTPPVLRKVFVVHGHDEGMKHSVARTLNKLELEPIILSERPDIGRTIIEKFEQESDVGYAVALLSPDDIGYAVRDGEDKAKHRPRQNVVAKMFFFIGTLGRKKVLPLVKGNVEVLSDYSGVVYTPFDDHGGWQIRLVSELKAVGYRVDANKLH